MQATCAWGGPQLLTSALLSAFSGLRLMGPRLKRDMMAADDAALLAAVFPGLGWFWCLGLGASNP